MAAPLPPVSRLTFWALPAICGLAALLYWIYWTPYGGDDPWITYRYAENLASGLGFVYNEGERVLGTTTPLYTLILAAASRLGLSVPTVSWTINFLAMITSIILLFLLVRRLYGEQAGIAAAGLLAGAQMFHRIATLGMETSLYTVLILGAFLAYLSGRELLASGLAACCLLMRPDGALVGAALFLVHVIGKREVPWRASMVYVVVTAPWLIFSWLYFDSVLPNTIIAKRLHTQQTVILWLPRWLMLEFRTLPALIGFGVLLWRAESRRRTAPLAVWAAIYVAAFSLGGSHGYLWYYTPLLLAMAAGAGVAVVTLGNRLGRTGFTRLGIAAALAGGLLLPDAGRAWLRIQGDEGILGVERTRYEAALWMRDNLPPGVPIATGGIGLVGYYTRRQIYDAMGLVTPGSMRLIGEIGDPRQMPFPRFLPAVIEDYRPEYIFDGFWLADEEAMPTFMRGRYVLVKEWPLRMANGPRFILFRRTSGADAIGVTR